MSKADKSKEEIVNELKEQVRVALLSVNGADAISVAARQNLMTFGQAIEQHPDDVLTRSMGLLNATQLKALGDTSSLGNHRNTIHKLAKTMFANDDAAVVAMSSTLNYITAAQRSICEYAFMSEYYGQVKTKFRDDCVAKYGQAMAHVGMAAGVAAAKAAAAPKAKAAA